MLVFVISASDGMQCLEMKPIASFPFVSLYPCVRWPSLHAIELVYVIFIHPISTHPQIIYCHLYQQ